MDRARRIMEGIGVFDVPAAVEYLEWLAGQVREKAVGWVRIEVKVYELDTEKREKGP